MCDIMFSFCPPYAYTGGRQVQKIMYRELFARADLFCLRDRSVMDKGEKNVPNAEKCRSLAQEN